eukprot:superscaffoldBa00000252_g3192
MAVAVDVMVGVADCRRDAKLLYIIHRRITKRYRPTLPKNVWFVTQCPVNSRTAACWYLRHALVLLQLNQHIPYLGLHLDSHTMTAQLSEECVEALRLTRHVGSAALVLAGSVMSLLRIMSAAHLVVRLELLNMRNLQCWLTWLQLHPS